MLIDKFSRARLQEETDLHLFLLLAAFIHWLSLLLQLNLQQWRSGNDGWRGPTVNTPKPQSTNTNHVSKSICRMHHHRSWRQAANHTASQLTDGNDRRRTAKTKLSRRRTTLRVNWLTVMTGGEPRSNWAGGEPHGESADWQKWPAANHHGQT